MTKIIHPKDFLKQQKRGGTPLANIKPTDRLKIAELGVTFTFSVALNKPEFYDALKKAVSSFNSEAALNGIDGIDFDDLYTKYDEYLSALASFAHFKI